MRVECAVLCDSATVREGLLHVLGAGVTGTTASTFPTYLHVTFAFRAVLESRETKTSHVLRVAVRDAVQEKEVADTSVTFVRQEGAEAGPEEALVFPLSLEDVQIPRAGKYLIQGSLDGKTLVTIPFRVERDNADDADDADDA